jgi:hypothetical protein
MTMTNVAHIPGRSRYVRCGCLHFPPGIDIHVIHSPPLESVPRSGCRRLLGPHVRHSVADDDEPLSLGEWHRGEVRCIGRFRRRRSRGCASAPALADCAAAALWPNMSRSAFPPSIGTTHESPTFASRAVAQAAFLVIGLQSVGEDPRRSKRPTASAWPPEDARAP